MTLIITRSLCLLVLAPLAAHAEDYLALARKHELKVPRVADALPLNRHGVLGALIVRGGKLTYRARAEPIGSRPVQGQVHMPDYQAPDAFVVRVRGGEVSATAAQIDAHLAKARKGRGSVQLELAEAETVGTIAPAVLRVHRAIGKRLDRVRWRAPFLRPAEGRAEHDYGEALVAAMGARKKPGPPQSKTELARPDVLIIADASLRWTELSGLLGALIAHRRATRYSLLVQDVVEGRLTARAVPIHLPQSLSTPPLDD